MKAEGGDDFVARSLLAGFAACQQHHGEQKQIGIEAAASSHHIALKQLECLRK
jgi:hypothetical protein